MPAINLLFCTHTFNLLDESLVAYIIFVCPVYSWWVNLTVLSTERIVLFLFSKKSIDKCLNEAPSLFKLVTISWPASMCLLALNCMKCFSSRIGENLEQSLPSLKELVLTSNNIQELVSTFQQQQQNHLNVLDFYFAQNGERKVY